MDEVKRLGRGDQSSPPPPPWSSFRPSLGLGDPPPELPLSPDVLDEPLPELLPEPDVLPLESEPPEPLEPLEPFDPVEPPWSSAPADPFPPPSCLCDFGDSLADGVGLGEAVWASPTGTTGAVCDSEGPAIA